MLSVPKESLSAAMSASIASYSCSVTMAMKGLLVGLGVGLDVGGGSVGLAVGCGCEGAVDGASVKVPGRMQGGLRHPSLVSDPASSIFVKVAWKSSRNLVLSCLYSAAASNVSAA